MYSSNYNDLDSLLNYGSQVNDAYNWTIVALVLSVVGGILAYILFVKKDVKIENKFLIWFKSFLDFKEMLIETILKVSYIVLAIFITLLAFKLISVSFMGFLVSLVFGNLMLRLIYEASLMFVMIWRNTSEINNKMKK